MSTLPHMSIIIPYRDRAGHLKALLPHLCAYFSRDVLASRIPLDIVIVEQAPGGPFNRGLLLNIGAALAKDRADYFSFHDVDYLPIWADYGWPEAPCSIVWHGFVRRPLAPENKAGITHLDLKIDLEACFGAVQLASKAQFTKVNGFSNDYWGYGFEDDDLRHRFLTVGIEFGRRRGTFQPLVHVSKAFKADGMPTEELAYTQTVFRNRWGHPGCDNQMDREGLSSLEFTVVEREAIGVTPPPEREIPIERVVVKFPVP